MKQVQAYKCDFCPRCFARKVNAIQHEERCKNNPIMRSCKTCKHGVLRAVRHIEELEILDAYCKKQNMPISDKPYFDECDISCGPYGEEIPIPFTCENYEYKGKAEWTKEEVEVEE